MKTAPRHDSQLENIRFLKTIPLFASLKDDALDMLVADFSPYEYAKDDVLFWQGDASTEMYLLRQGKVRIYKISPNGRETSISIFSTGNVICAIAYGNGNPGRNQQGKCGAIFGATNPSRHGPYGARNRVVCRTPPVRPPVPHPEGRSPEGSWPPSRGSGAHKPAEDLQ